MWIVYNIEDSPKCGWEVSSQDEAERMCYENPELTYKYMDSAVNYNYCYEEF